MSSLETFDMYGKEAINDNDIDGKHHDHNDKDPCHRCNSLNTEIHSDCITGLIYWIYLECKDCGLCCIFGGGSD